MEAMKAKNIEVLFCFEPYDELVLMNLAQFENKHMKSIENELTDDSTEDAIKVDGGGEFSHTHLLKIKSLQHELF